MMPFGVRLVYSKILYDDYDDCRWCISYYLANKKD